MELQNGYLTKPDDVHSGHGCLPSRIRTRHSAGAGRGAPGTCMRNVRQPAPDMPRPRGRPTASPVSPAHYVALASRARHCRKRGRIVAGPCGSPWRVASAQKGARGRACRRSSSSTARRSRSRTASRCCRPASRPASRSRASAITSACRSPATAACAWSRCVGMPKPAGLLRHGRQRPAAQPRRHARR